MKPPLHITRCKRLRFAPSKFGFAELLLHRNRYDAIVYDKEVEIWKS
ncbi:MAG: hypothetical protein DDT29_02308 [Dehalococcoidia bacterium]|nr:hypothetical protein [Bacillota bacterium]